LGGVERKELPVAEAGDRTQESANARVVNVDATINVPMPHSAKESLVRTNLYGSEHKDADLLPDRRGLILRPDESFVPESGVSS